jgi:peptidoglycan/xylan/chitin deacetylase (PgdA/CDA1 family)
MMIGVRALIRGTVEVVATGAGLSRIGRRLNRDSVAVLAYHNIVEDTDANRGDTSLHLPIGIFLQQIERLCQTHDIVDLDALQRRSSSARPRAAITFDDAYRGAVTLALPELVRRGLPAVMFVSPGMLDSQSTWWDRLGEAGELTEARRHEALTALEGKRTLIDERMPTPSVTLPDNYAIASREELLEACGTAISIGSHAWEHEYLPALEPAELRDNLERSRRGVELRSSGVLNG